MSIKKTINDSAADAMAAVVLIVAVVAVAVFWVANH